MTFYIDNLISEGVINHQSHVTGVTSTVTSAGTVSLTISSTAIQIFTGSTAGQIVKLPDATTLIAGYRYQFHNNSTQNVTIQDGSGASLVLLAANYRAFFVLASPASQAGTWSYFVVLQNPATPEQFLVTYPGTGLAVNYTGGNVHYNGTFYNVVGGTITLPDSTTNGWIYVTTAGVVAATASLPTSTGTVGVVPLYKFTTLSGAVTSLIDERQDDESNLTWATAGQISGITYNASTAAGTLDVYARGDHVHGANLLLTKSGSIGQASFTGTPRVATVTFGPAMPSTSYAVTVTGTDGRSWVVNTITTGGFKISSQANAALTGPVFWMATLNGEST